MNEQLSSNRVPLQLTAAMSFMALLAMFMFISQQSLAAGTFAADTTGVATAEVVTSERAEELTHLLLHDCGSCHGMTLKGGLGPSLLPEQFKDKNADYIKYTILHGRNGTPMPPWKSIISESDAEWLAEFLLSGRIVELNK